MVVKSSYLLISSISSVSSFSVVRAAASFRPVSAVDKAERRLEMDVPDNEGRWRGCAEEEEREVITLGHRRVAFWNELAWMMESQKSVPLATSDAGIITRIVLLREDLLTRPVLFPNLQ